jgi:hypothetical protein
MLELGDSKKEREIQRKELEKGLDSLEDIYACA